MARSAPWLATEPRRLVYSGRFPSVLRAVMTQDRNEQDLMGYEALAQEALRGVVKAALRRAAAPGGLPGQHHFYITFKTRGPGVSVPPELAERYPDEMTIVLQHQYWDLAPGETFFSITLKFGGQPKKLSVPYAAVTRFYDPASTIPACSSCCSSNRPRRRSPRRSSGRPPNRSRCRPGHARPPRRSGRQPTKTAKSRTSPRSSRSTSSGRSSAQPARFVTRMAMRSRSPGRRSTRRRATWASSWKA
jgi:uncharacterized protein